MSATTTLRFREFTFQWAVDGAADISGRTAPFTPRKIEVSYTKTATWFRWRVEVSGARRLKSGEVGLAPMSIRYWDDSSDTPGWVTQLVKLHTPQGWDQ